MKALEVEVPPSKEPPPSKFFSTPNGGGKRLDIQGVRAVAIISVLLYHFFPAWCPNGLYGVDMFFVVSGYVMSLVLSRQSSMTFCGAFTFYKRRVKRIAPIYYLVVFTTALLSMFSYLISCLQESMSRLVSALAMYTNLNAIHQNQRYSFEVATDSRALFVHTWSLSVEIQFYLVVPLIFFIYKNLFKNNKYLCGGFSLTVIGISIYKSYNYLSHHDQQRYFYHTYGRVWQFFVGILAYQLGTALEKMASKLYTISTFGGLVIVPIVVCNLFPYELEQTSYRMTATVSTGALLLCGSFSSNLILTNSLMEYVGNLSYALYLVHWPTLTLFKYLAQLYRIELIIAILTALVVTVVLSVLIHHFFEKILLKAPIVYSILVSVIFAVGCIAMLFTWKPVYMGRFEANKRANLEANLAMLNPPPHDRDGSHLHLEGEHPYPYISFPKGNGSARILLLGNSYAQQQIQVLRRIIGNDYADLYMFGKPGNNVFRTYYAEVTAASRALAAALKPDILIVLLRYYKQENRVFFKNSKNDPVMTEYRKQAAYYEQLVDHILIESPQPKYPMQFLNTFIDQMEMGRDLRKLNMKLNNTNVENVWPRIKVLKNACKKCQLLRSDLPFLDKKRQIYHTYDEKTNLSYVDNTIHFTQPGLAMLDESYASVIRPLLKKYTKMRAGKKKSD